MGKKWGRTQAIWDEHMPDIERAYEGGAEIKEIAIRYGVSGPTITNWLIDAGYRKKRRGRYPIVMKEKAVELANRGWSAQAIANLFRVKVKWVLLWLGEETEQTIEFREVFDPALQDTGRHKRGRRWTREQKIEVLDHLNVGLLSVSQIYQMTGASRRRQVAIWKEFMGDRPFPHARVRRPRRVSPDYIIEPVTVPAPAPEPEIIDVEAIEKVPATPIAGQEELPEG